MSTEPVKTYDRLAQLSVPLLSLGLFVASMFLPTQLIRGNARSGWSAALLALIGTLSLFHDGGWQSFVPCVLGTLANVAFLAAWFSWEPNRRISVIAALIGFSACIGCVLALVLPMWKVLGAAQFWAIVGAPHFWTRTLGVGYWTWISAPAVLLLGAFARRAPTSRPGGFPVAATEIQAAPATDSPAMGNRGASPRKAKVRRLAVFAAALLLTLLSSVALIWWRVIPHAMLFAAREGRYSTVKFLLAIGGSANVEEIDAPGFFLGAPGIRTPLYESIRRSDLSMMELLLKHGADPNRFCGPPNDTHYPLDYALQKNSDAMIRLLWSHGARLPGARQAMVELRVSNAPANFARSVQGRQFLVLASTTDIQSVRALLDAGADPNFIDPNRREPLIFNADPDALALLLSHGANPDARDFRQRTALHVAAAHRQLKSLTLLLDHGAEVDAQDTSGQTPLYEAVVNNFAEGVKLLLERGADPDLQTQGGDTARSLAESNPYSSSLASLFHEHTRPPPLVDTLSAPPIDLHQWQVMCWQNRRWVLYPPGKMALSEGPDAVHVENTTQDNWLATFAYTDRSFDNDFDAVVEVRGAHFVTFISDDGADHTVICDCPADSQWHVFTLRRRRERLTFNIDGRPARARLNNVVNSAFRGYIAVQIEKSHSADLRRFEARAAAADNAPLLAPPTTKPRGGGGADRITPSGESLYRFLPLRAMADSDG